MWFSTLSFTKTNGQIAIAKLLQPELWTKKIQIPETCSSAIGETRSCFLRGKRWVIISISFRSFFLLYINEKTKENLFDAVFSLLSDMGRDETRKQTAPETRGWPDQSLEWNNYCLKQAINYIFVPAATGFGMVPVSSVLHGDDDQTPKRRQMFGPRGSEKGICGMVLSFSSEKRW